MDSGRIETGPLRNTHKMRFKKIAYYYEDEAFLPLIIPTIASMLTSLIYCVVLYIQVNLSL